MFPFFFNYFTVHVLLITTLISEARTKEKEAGLGEFSDTKIMIMRVRVLLKRVNGPNINL